MLSAHEVLGETREILENLDVTSKIRSDHYTNYVNVCGSMPDDRENMLSVIHEALRKDESFFRPVYVGTQ